MTESGIKKDIYAVAGHNISVFRKRKGLKLGELAKKSGISQSFLGNIEKGTRKPTLYTLEKVSRALGIGITALFSSRQGGSLLPEDNSVVFEIMKLVASKSPEDRKRILNMLRHF